jgi:hypothetical protein
MIVEQTNRVVVHQLGSNHYELTDKQYPSGPGYRTITFTHKHAGDLKRKLALPLKPTESMEKRLRRIFETANRRVQENLGLGLRE